MNSYISEATKQKLQELLLKDGQFLFQKCGNMLRGGICPKCGNKSLWVSYDEPFRINCDRKNKCQWSSKTTDLYPEIFRNFTSYCPPTPENPNASADAYLEQRRGLDIAKLQGMYALDRYMNDKSGKWFYAVKVPIADDLAQYFIINESDIAKNLIRGKAVGKPIDGKINGRCWMPKGMKVRKGDEIWITESIFKSMALFCIGKKSVTSLSCGTFPKLFFEENRGKSLKWVIAMDNDKAGQDAALKHKRFLEDADENVLIAFPRSGEDWDDALKFRRLDEDYLRDSFYRGRLFTASTAKEYAFFHYCRHKSTYFQFQYRNQLYRTQIKENAPEQLVYPDPKRGWNVERVELMSAFSDFLQISETNLICTGLIIPRYMEINRETDERKIFIQIISPNNNKEKMIEVKGSVWTNLTKFKDTIADGTGVTFRGSQNDINDIYDKWWNGSIIQVDSVPFFGYDMQSGIYFFPDFAYRKGVFERMNSYGYIEFQNHAVKSFLGAASLNMVRECKPFDPFWILNYKDCFGMNGLVLLAWWTGTLFAEQIRRKYRFWPFLECTGKAGTGKSTQIKFLWKALGVAGDWEGFTATATSEAGIAREMAKFANLPSVLIESDMKDEKKKQKFNFNRFKSAFEGGLLRVVGKSGGSLETEQLKFRSGMLIAQNHAIEAEEAFYTRIIYCEYKEERFTEESRRKVMELEQMTAEDLGGFLHAVLSKEESLLDGFSRIFPEMVRRFNELEKTEGGVSRMRIRETHAMIAAWLKLLPEIFGSRIDDREIESVIAFLWERAKVEARRANGEDSQVTLFWDAFELLNMMKGVELNHTGSESQIAINLQQVYKAARDTGVPIPPIEEVQPKLKDSTTFRFVGIKPVRSVIPEMFSKVVKCWVFNRKKNNDENED